MVGKNLDGYGILSETRIRITFSRALILLEDVDPMFCIQINSQRFQDYPESSLYKQKQWINMESKGSCAHL